MKPTPPDLRCPAYPERSRFCAWVCRPFGHRRLVGQRPLSSALSALSAVTALVFTGCATRTAAPAVITAAVPATCPHPGIIWGPWSEITIVTLVKTSRVRECRRCGWVQTQSEIKTTAAQ